MSRSPLTRHILLALTFLGSAPTLAQQAPLLLTPLLVEAQRIDSLWQEAPAALSVIDTEDIANGRPQLQPSDALAFAPGVLVQNRDNFAQNPRISIRGFGARAPFGVRGIRVRMDGIPLNSVDGQAQLDAINSHNIARIEVLRSANTPPASRPQPSPSLPIPPAAAFAPISSPSTAAAWNSACVARGCPCIGGHGIYGTCRG